MATKKTTALTANTTPATTDIIAMVDDPGGTPLSQKITLANFLKVINGLTEDTAPSGTNDFLVSYDASAAAAKKVKVNRVGSIVLAAHFAATNPADATTYYFGAFPSIALSTTATASSIYIPRAAVLTGAKVEIFAGGGGGAETSTLSFRLNNTTDTALSAAITVNPGLSIFTASGLSTSLAAGDYFEIKWVTPTWATNPTGVYGMVMLMFE